LNVGEFFQFILLMNNNAELSPFLKWAGGKRWFVKRYADLIPSGYNRYLEPFLGSGAVFFHLRPSYSILADTNEELIGTYQAIKEDWPEVFKLLKVHSKNHSSTYYYKIRSLKLRGRYSRAARFIYLNRTCWNGLYRVNLHGQFNVPKGTKDAVLLDTDDFQTIASSLAHAELLVADFEKTIDLARKGDLIFVDPPYTVKHKSNGFIKYNEHLFHWDDQLRLHASLIKAKKKGAMIILTNASHSSVRKLYRDSFEILTVNRISVIAADSHHRKQAEEFIIRSV